MEDDRAGVNHYKMKNPTLKNLGHVLENVDSFPTEYALYIGKSDEWIPGDTCAVLNPDDADEESNEPEFEIRHDMSYGLGMDSVLDIVENAREQGVSDQKGLVKALNFYYDNDAFIHVR